VTTSEDALFKVGSNESKFAMNVSTTARRTHWRHRGQREGEDVTHRSLALLPVVMPDVVGVLLVELVDPELDKEGNSWSVVRAGRHSDTPVSHQVQQPR
jgi:hypothetical protein